MASMSGSPTFSMMQLDEEMDGQLDDSQRAGPSVQSVSRSNKAMAAISGAAVTSLMMTPFDVIKTRMQIQAPQEPLFMPSSASPPSVTCCQSTSIAARADLACQHDPRISAAPGKGVGSSGDLLRAAASSTNNEGAGSAHRARMIRMTPQMSSGPGISAIACDFTDRDMAIRELEKSRNSSRLAGLWDGVAKVGRAEGPRGLWRGLTPTLAMTVPSQVTYMTCYDSIRQYILSFEQQPRATSSTPSLSNVTSHTLAASLISGSISRGVSATLVTPLELLRTRSQASRSTSTSGKLSAIILDLAQEVKRSGPKVMFRGLVPTLYRDVPFSALYFTGYESMKRVLTGSGLGERNKDDGRVKEFSVAFVSGSTSGIFAAIVTQPFDLVKTRLQAEAANTGRQNSSTLHILRQIVKDDGAGGLFRGLSPRMAKVAPACGIMIASFEFVGRWLEENRPGRKFF